MFQVEDDGFMHLFPKILDNEAVKQLFAVLTGPLSVVDLS